MKVRGRSALLTVVAMAALAGCSGGQRDEGSTSTAAAPAGGTAERMPATDGKAPGALPAEGLTGTGQQVPAQAPDLSVDQRSIIYTGTINVRMRAGNSVDAAAANAASIATGSGGFVGSDKRSSGTGHAEATLELRVPAGRFTTVVNQLATLGSEERRSIDTQDVTEQTLDLDSRIKSQSARVDSGRALLAQAKNLADLVMLEKELATREADLASLQAKQRRLADLTALSTITVVLLDASTSAPTAEQSGFVGGLSAGWDALVASLKVLLTVLGALLPWLIAIGLPVSGLLWLIRRARRRTPEVVATTTTEPAPAE